MLALVRWYRVLVLALAGLLLFSPLIYLQLRGLSPDAAEVERLAEDFFRAVRERDQERLRGVLAPGAQPLVVDQQRGRLLLVPGGMSAEIQHGRTNFQGSTARVEFTLTREPAGGPDVLIGQLVPRNAVADLRRAFVAELERLLSRLDGQRGFLRLARTDSRRWHVVGMEWPVNETGVGVQASFVPGAFPPTPAPPATTSEYRLLRPLTPAEVDRSWQSDHLVQGEVTGKVADRLAKELGLQGLVTQGGVPEGWRDRLCRLQLKQRSRLEALSRALEQVGLAWDLAGAGLLLRPHRAPDHAMAGPFRVRVTQQHESPQDATGMLTLSADALELPATARRLLERTTLLVTELQATAVDGRDLVFAERYARLPAPRPRLVQLLGGRPREQEGVTAQWLVPLRNLTADVRQVASLKGRVGLHLPTKVEEGRLAVSRSARVTIGDVELHLDERATKAVANPLQATGNWTLTARGPARRFVGLEGIDVTGAPRGAWWLVPPHTMSVDLSSVAVLNVRVATLTSHSYPFELRSVPLVQRAPARLAELAHPGHPAPVTVAAALSPKRQPTLTFRNVSSKGVDQVSVQVRCLGARKQELARSSHTVPAKGQWPPTLSLSPSSVLTQAWLGVGDQKDVNLSLTPPVQTDALAAAVERVVFTDGTAWTAPPAK